MNSTLVLVGEPAGIFAALAASLRRAPGVPDGPAALLVNLPGDTEEAIGAATRFAEAAPDDGADRLVVNVLDAAPPSTAPPTGLPSVTPPPYGRSRNMRRSPGHPGGSGSMPYRWARRPHRPGSRRKAPGAPRARYQAPRANEADMQSAILALARWRSMTGQMIRLGA